MEIKVQFTGARAKAVEQVQRQGWRDGDVRVIRRAQSEARVT
jgi:hypothetical protein